MWVVQLDITRCSQHRYIMEKVDLVMVGAEGVAESGGVINKVE